MTLKEQMAKLNKMDLVNKNEDESGETSIEESIA
jgi:hypothetical protein